MEEHNQNNSQRSLAYTLAKPIDTDSLDQVSGGNAVGAQMSCRDTFAASGMNRQNMDVVVDWTADFG